MWPLLEALALLAAPVISGAILVLAFVQEDHKWLAWVALVPLAFAMRRRWPCAELVLGFFLGGLVVHLGGLDFIRTSQTTHETLGPRTMEWLFLGVAGGLYWTVSLTIASAVVRRNSWPLVVLLPVVWVSHEYLRKIAFGFFDEVGFPWLQLGTTQAERLSLIQIADFGGVWAVTGVIAGVNGMIADVVIAGMDSRCRWPLAFASTSCATGVVVACIAYGHYRLNEESHTEGPVACLVPNGIQATELGREALTQCAEQADLLLWSETAHGNLGGFHKGVEFGDVAWTARIVNATLFVTGDRRIETHRRRSMVVASPEGVQGVYDKQKLVPWNEFTPWFRIHGVTRNGSDFQPGRGAAIYEVIDRAGRQWGAAPAICYDACFPEVTRNYWSSAEAGPDFFVVSSCEDSDGTMTVQRYILALARFRAVETRRALVRNAYSGYSGLIDSLGRLAQMADQAIIREPMLCGPVPIDHRRAAYVHLGDWIPWLCISFLGALLARQWVRTGLASH